ncbi:MAG: STAS domain-containing protein [Gemmatimonadota bacterium]|nr:MAG: STAS domain-containing protein [Gemmatimonadota bacterium]
MWFKKRQEGEAAKDSVESPECNGTSGSIEMVERIEKDIVVVHPEGKIMGGDETTTLCDTLRQLMNEGIMKIVMDFGKVTWINSAGIGVIMGCFTTLRRMGGNMKFASPSDKVKYYLQITKLNTVFEIFDSSGKAVDSFH